MIAEAARPPDADHEAHATGPGGANRAGGAGNAPRWSGVLIVDKPAGVTSHDVIDIVRRRFRERSAGHLGTLDPAASGLLAVALGAATRCVPVWQGGEKTYEATVRFGLTTSTQDTTGEVLEEHPVTVSEATVREAASGLAAETMQIPPMVSAVRVGGERLYRLARRGITVERAPRPIRVAAWEWLGFDLPCATFRVRCSKGTYVRTLAHDLGQRLGCGGALQALRRLRSEPFDLGRSVTVRDLLEIGPEDAWDRAGIPLDAALEVLPALMLDDSGTRAVGHGGSIALDPARAESLPRDAGPRSIVLRDPSGAAVALGELRVESGEARVFPRAVFPWAVREGRPGES